jgi:hypothetical protein
MGLADLRVPASALVTWGEGKGNSLRASGWVANPIQYESKKKSLCRIPRDHFPLFILILILIRILFLSARAAHCRDHRARLWFVSQQTALLSASCHRPRERVSD